jgi:hypothetical protein
MKSIISKSQKIKCNLKRSPLYSKLSLYIYLILFIFISFACQQEPWIQVNLNDITSSSSVNTISSSLKKKSLIADQIHVPQSMQSTATYLTQVLPQIRSSIKQQLALNIPFVEIYVSHSEKAMQHKAQQQEGFRPPDWAHGLAYAHSKHIYLHEMSPKELYRVCMHEMIHIALGQQKKIPRWVNEGLAVIVSEGISWQRMLTVQQASLGVGFINFTSLIRNFPSSGSRAQLAYAQSTHMLSWLRDRYGMQALQKWIHALMQGQKLQPASFYAFDSTWTTIEKGWYADITYSPVESIAFLVQESTIFFIGIMIFLIGGFRVLRIRKKERILLDQEAPEITVRHRALPISKFYHPIDESSLEEHHESSNSL